MKKSKEEKEEGGNLPNESTMELQLKQKIFPLELLFFLKFAGSMDFEHNKFIK